MLDVVEDLLTIHISQTTVILTALKSIQINPPTTITITITITTIIIVIIAMDALIVEEPGYQVLIFAPTANVFIVFVKNPKQAEADTASSILQITITTVITTVITVTPALVVENRARQQVLIIVLPANVLIADVKKRKMEIINAVSNILVVTVIK